MRLSEDPDDRLQPLQDGLNDYLQAVYWHQRSEAAHGFVAVPAGNPSPRHIETNAARAGSLHGYSARRRIRPPAWPST